MNQKQLINQEQLMNQEQLANFIKTIRRDYSLSQTSLARILMVDSSQLELYLKIYQMKLLFLLS